MTLVAQGLKDSATTRRFLRKKPQQSAHMHKKIHACAGLLVMKGFLFMGRWGGDASRGLSASTFHVSHVNAGHSLSS